MLTFSGYQILAQIYQSASTLVYRARRELDGRPVILKLLQPNYPTLEELTRYRQEYEIIRGLRLEGVIKAYSLQKYQNTLIMSLEDFGGESLQILLKSRNFTLAEFFYLARETAEILSQIHGANIIHKDINPANIVFNRETKQVKLIDFGISTALSRESLAIANPRVLEGTIAYMSPEQTGRMNCPLDYRTDLYSLGTTFYQLLTGQLPFVTTDALELIHCHLAKQPLPPHQLIPQIPLAVSQIVMKLLAKTPEARYQTAGGLKADLIECWRQLETKGEIDNFPLAREDISGKFQISQKLYGRERERAVLLAAFERVATGATNEPPVKLITVTGHSGIGKSALVRELYRPITQRRGYFISGKFEQLQRNIPYAAIAHAFRSLVQQLLSENEPKLARWREQILAAVGVNGRIISELIPEVELIIGSQPTLPPLEPNELQNLFKLVFCDFVRVFCKVTHPLVIFLDDLQWADAASLSLLAAIVGDEPIPYLFIIGAYRDNEVSQVHPLAIALESLQTSGAKITALSLKPLKLAEITHLISETLSQDEKVVSPLAELVLDKTEGNPFFVREFLQALYRDKLLVFDWQRRSWQWDIAAMERRDITDNVVELMVEKLKQLKPETQQVLRLAACVGSSFDLDTLAVVRETRPATIYTQLIPAIEQGVILPTSKLEAVSSANETQLLILNYKFLHDRLQQAAYALIDKEQKQQVHLQIGRLLLKNTPPTQRAEKVFSLVAQFNRARETIGDVEERLTLVKLNLMAGKKAKVAAAYQASQDYLQIASDLLCELGDRTNYKLFFALHLELAEVEYLNGNFDPAAEIINFTLAKTQNAIEKAELYRVLILLYTATAKYKKAIETGILALTLLNIQLPQSDLATAIEREIFLITQKLGAVKISSYYHQPEMVIATKKAAMKIMGTLDAAAYMYDTDLYALLTAKQVNLCLEHGNLPEAFKFYTDYGIVLIHALGDYQTAYEFGTLAVKLCEKYQNSSQKCKVLLVFSWLSFWLQPMKLSAEMFDIGYRSGLSSGELQFAGYALAYRLFASFYRGKPLTSIQSKIADSLHFCQKTKNYLGSELIAGLELVLSSLMGLGKLQQSFQSDRLSETQYLQGERSPHAICIYYILKSQALYLYDRFLEALDCLQEAEKFLTWIAGQHFISDHNFYHSLVLSALYAQAADSERQQYLKTLTANQQQLKVWVDNCSQNFLHKYLLVAAEIARISQQDLAAMDLYDCAIASAREVEYHQYEAIANELAAKFYLHRGKVKIARLYLTDAVYAFEKWGATAKVEDLRQKYSQLLLATTPRQAAVKGEAEAHLYSTNKEPVALDLQTVIKASQTLSGEIVLDKLLEKLMKILIENAGAQKGCLILPSAQSPEKGEVGWKIQAVSSIDTDGVTFVRSISIDSLDFSCQNSLVPAAIVNYVARSRENVVLKDAAREGQFTRDPYIVANRLKSILCTPLIHQGKLSGILYLENNLTTGAFTPERVEISNILSVQAAISIENSRLYQQLEHYNQTLEKKVRTRTRELQEKNQQLANTLQQLKTTQAQIIAQEKLASLGTLAAAIAHEIKNPLNFVNNFAQLSVELSQELSEEIQDRSDRLNPETQEYIAEIIRGLGQNAQKIEKHGKRADNIVCGMLMLSKGQSGIRQWSDLNALLVESINLAYHGMRAKNPSFKLTIKTNYDEQLGEFNIFTQDISRTFINVINNACYAVNLKREELGEEFVPLLTVTTKNLSDGAEIRIKDNGKGIPQQMLTEIFNPFFSTKPAGEGTGLGLSISHDIIVQRHRGKIRVESEVNSHTEIIIFLPK